MNLPVRKIIEATLSAAVIEFSSDDFFASALLYQTVNDGLFSISRIELPILALNSP